MPPFRTENFSLILLYPALVGSCVDLIDFVSWYTGRPLFRVFGPAGGRGLLHESRHEHDELGEGGTSTLQMARFPVANGSVSGHS